MFVRDVVGIVTKSQRCRVQESKEVQIEHTYTRCKVDTVRTVSPSIRGTIKNRGDESKTNR